MYLLCLSPYNVLQAGSKALADPFLSPVSGSNHKAKPGVGNLMANPGPTKRQASHSQTRISRAQHTLGQEDYMGAVENKGHNIKDKLKK